ncbi:MAG: alpha/beta hydrolase fold domain-containing protein [Planctomycetota bacterium]
MPLCRALIVYLIFTTATAFAQQRRGRSLEPWVKGAFKTQDVNSDGVVTKDEAKGLLKSNFARVDADSDGKVTPDELQVVAKQIRADRNRTNQQKKGDQRSAKVPDNVELKTDIAYRPDHKRQTLDLMLPKEKSEQPRPALVIIHGGGWRGGDKGGGMWRSLPLQYASKGYVCISVNYRLTPDGVDIFDCIEDCRCAVRWLRANAEKYNVDPKRIGAFGNSAGAHLVSLIGLTPDDTSFDGDAPYKGHSSGFQAVCCGAPPTNFMDFGKDRKQANPVLFGKVKDGAKRASPVTWVNDNAPPFLIIHGTKDGTVPVKNGDDLNAALKKVGADVTYLRIDGAGHGAVGQHREKTYPAMEEFFARVLKP